jgi:hypothetical protein
MGKTVHKMVEGVEALGGVHFEACAGSILGCGTNLLECTLWVQSPLYLSHSYGLRVVVCILVL